MLRMFFGWMDGCYMRCDILTLIFVWMLYEMWYDHFFLWMLYEMWYHHDGGWMDAILVFTWHLLSCELFSCHYHFVIKDCYTRCDPLNCFHLVEFTGFVVLHLFGVIVVEVVGLWSRRCSTTSSTAEGELRSHLHLLRSFNHVTRFHYLIKSRNLGVSRPKVLHR